MAGERSRRRAWLAGVVIVAVVTILYLSGGILSGLRSAANAVVTPFSWAVDIIARPIGHTLAGAINYSDVVAQNQRLRYELGRAQLRANEEWAYARDLEQISTQLSLPFVGNLATVAAQVTSVSPTNFAATFDIAKGRDDGVLSGMPVAANGGLVGRVIATTPHGATVQMLSDPHSIVATTFARGGTTVFVSGRGVNNPLAATSVPLTTSVSPGTKLTTSAMSGGLYPAGLPVATVKTVSLTPGAQTYDLVLTPAANLSDLSFVDVVLWEPTQ